MKGFIAMYVLIGTAVGIGASDAEVSGPTGFPVFVGVAWPAMVAVIVTETANNIHDKARIDQ